MLCKHNELKEERKEREKLKFNFDTLYSKEFCKNAANERQYLQAIQDIKSTLM